MLTPKIDTSERVLVEATANAFTTTMAPGEVWLFTSTVACWLLQGAAEDTPTATADAPSMYVAANREVLLEPGFDQGDTLSVIRASGDGAATLTQMRERADFAGA